MSVKSRFAQGVRIGTLIARHRRQMMPRVIVRLRYMRQRRWLLCL